MFVYFFTVRIARTDSLTISFDAKAIWFLKHFLGSSAEGSCLSTTEPRYWWEVTAGAHWYSNYFPEHLISLNTQPASCGWAPPPAPASFILSGAQERTALASVGPPESAPAFLVTKTRTITPKSARLLPEGSRMVPLTHSDLPFEAAFDFISLMECGHYRTR